MPRTNQQQPTHDVRVYHGGNRFDQVIFQGTFEQCLEVAERTKKAIAPKWEEDPDVRKADPINNRYWATPVIPGGPDWEAVYIGLIGETRFDMGEGEY